MAILTISSIFAESANRLPKETRAKLPKVFNFLITNPRHPSLKLKKIKGAIRPNVYECRVDRSWRLGGARGGGGDAGGSAGARLARPLGPHRPLAKLGAELGGGQHGLEART